MKKPLQTRYPSIVRVDRIKWANEKAIQLKAAAARNPFEKTIYQSHILSLGMYINITSSIQRASIKVRDRDRRPRKRS